MALSLEQVRHVARLARLALSPDEEETYRAQLGAILSHVDERARVDVAGVAPMTHAGDGTGALREDALRPSLGAERVANLAPAHDGTSVAVPKIIE